MEYWHQCSKHRSFVSHSVLQRDHAYSTFPPTIVLKRNGFSWPPKAVESGGRGKGREWLWLDSNIPQLYELFDSLVSDICAAPLALVLEILPRLNNKFFKAVFIYLLLDWNKYWNLTDINTMKIKYSCSWRRVKRSCTLLKVSIAVFLFWKSLIERISKKMAEKK